MRYVAFNSDINDFSRAYKDMTSLWVEVEESGGVVREIGFNNSNEVIHIYPSEGFKHGHYGLMDLTVVEFVTDKPDDVKQLDFEDLWRKHAVPRSK